MMQVEKVGQKRKNKWYERYLPFIAQNPESQVAWLVYQCHKKKLTAAEMTPYLRLLFNVSNVEVDSEMRSLLSGLSQDEAHCFVEIADIYDLPRLIRVLPMFDKGLTCQVLQKEMPSYEKNHQKLVDQVFYAVNDRSPQLLTEVAEAEVPIAEHFGANLERFQKILEDEAFLRSMYQNAN